MRIVTKVMRRVRTLFRRRRFELELDEELSFHLEMQTRWHEAQGLDHATASALAAREFGGTVRFREAVLDTRGLSWAHDISRDVRFALRSYRRAPGFTAVALLTLVLGIGTTTAAFSVIHAVLIRPLPYEKPEQIVTLTGLDSLGHEIQTVSVPNYDDWRAQSHSFSSIALYATARRAVVTAGEAAYVETANVSGDFFSVLGVPPAIGRTLTPVDVGSGEPVAVVSHGFWTGALGSPRRLPTEPVRIGDDAYRIVGVLPPALEYPSGVDLFVPDAFGAPWRTSSRNNINFNALGRLADGVTIDRARAEMRTIARRVHAAHPEDLYARGVSVTTLQSHMVGSVETYLRLLAGAVGVVLLVACANLANANLARSTVRGRELSIRTALGAGRWRLVRQLGVESIALSIVGGAAGVALAWALVRLIARIAATELPRAGEIEINGTALAFALALSVAVGLLVGLAPVAQVARSALSLTIAGGRSTATRSRAASRDLLIGLELALAIVLLVGAGLLIRSFRAVISRDIGFNPDGAVAAELSLPPAWYSGSRAPAFYGELFSSLRALPGVTAVGATSFLPLGSSAAGFIVVEGQPDVGAGAGYRVVSDDYFRAMGIPLLRGRYFRPGDHSGTTRVTLVNRAMAERFWPGENPIGKRFKAKSMEWKDAPWLTVVGVVGNVRHWGLEQDVPVEHYVSYRQRPELALDMAVVVRGRGDPATLMRGVHDRIRAIDRDVPADLGTLTARIDRSLAERRFIMDVLIGFGGLALVLAAIGVYGVLSFTVAQRTREIAVRMALGAERTRVLTLVVAHVLRVAVLSALTGLIAARGVSRLMSALLFEVSPADPRTYVAVTAVLMAVALIAAYVPARRAASVDPMLALRGD